MGYTKYYDPKQSAWTSLFSWRATIFELVFSRTEFYLYIFWNIFITTCCIYAVKTNELDDFNWDAASIMQYVMTFFVTFYNDMCYTRYTSLYPACVDFMDNVVFLVQEIHVNFHWNDLKYHRIAMTKYAMACVYEHYMNICGGELQEDCWEQFVKKGLLTKEETVLLAQFPGGRATQVLCCWIKFILRHALVQDCMWRKSQLAHDVSQQTVHIYNRHVQHVVNIQRSAHRVGYILANPIPFSYYHLMNFILLFNILLLGTFTGLYRSYFSVVPYTIALLIYMGLREVSITLADPFGRDSLDFAVPDYIRNCFDRCVSIQLAFTRPETREWVLNQIESVEDFQEQHLRRYCKTTLFAETEDDVLRGTAVIMKWTRESCFEDSGEDVDIKRKLKLCMCPGVKMDELNKKGTEVADLTEKEQKLEALVAEEVAKKERIALDIKDWNFEYDRLSLLIKLIEEKFPNVLEDMSDSDGDDLEKSTRRSIATSVADSASWFDEKDYAETMQSPRSLAPSHKARPSVGSPLAYPGRHR